MAGYLIGDALRIKLRETINKVAEMPEGERPTRIETRFEDLPRHGGGGAMRLGKVTATWNKDSLRDVVVYGGGEALAEEAASPPVVVTECVNKFATVLADRWVIIGKMHGRWYLIAAEC